jgi:hypothetical protein
LLVCLLVTCVVQRESHLGNEHLLQHIVAQLGVGQPASTGTAGGTVHAAVLVVDVHAARGVCLLHDQLGEQRPEVRATHHVAVLLPDGLQHRVDYRGGLQKARIVAGVAQAAVGPHTVAAGDIHFTCKKKNRTSIDMLNEWSACRVNGKNGLTCIVKCQSQSFAIQIG